MRRRILTRASTTHLRAAATVPKAAGPEHLGEGETAPSLPDGEALRALLSRYEALLVEVESESREAAFPRRLSARSTWRWAVEHVRKSLAVLDRRFAAHAALSASPRSEDRERIRLFTESLPPPVSRLRPLLLGAVILVVAQALLPLATALPYGSSRPSPTPFGRVAGTGEREVEFNRVSDSLREVSDLSLSNMGEAVEVLFESSVLVSSFILAIVGAAAYLVLRPLANGAVGFRILRHGATAGRWPPFQAHRRRAAARLRIAELEERVFGSASLQAPPDPSFDLFVKACLVAPLLLVAVAVWHVFLSGASVTYLEDTVGPRGASSSLSWEGYASDAFVAAGLASLAAARLAWLGVEAHRRNAPRAAPADTVRPPTRRTSVIIGAVLAVAAAFGLYALADRRAPDVDLQVSAVTGSALRDGKLSLRYTCDEACEFDRLRFKQHGMRPVVGAAGDAMLKGQLSAPAGRPRNLTVELTPAGVAWLRSALRRQSPPTEELTYPGGPPGDSYVELTFSDGAGNATSATTAVVPAD